MAVKYVFVTGGVVSGLGKGITAASLGRLLKARGYQVTMQKFDPYINIDPGTMNPIQHGEVFVTDDGTETDLDLGHYERFIDESLDRNSNVTTGKIYWSVLQKERHGDFGGGTVQVIPHITNEIKSRFYRGKTPDEERIAIIEVGGTVGDIESQPFLEAIRQFRHEMGADHVALIHVTLIPYLKASGEMKTKPTQASVKELQGMGIQPDVLVCRSEYPLTEEIREKIALFCNVPVSHVLQNLDVEYLYEAPLAMEGEKLADVVLETLRLENRKPDLTDWQEMVRDMRNPEGEVNIAIVGKYTQLHDAYLSVVEALKHGGISCRTKVELTWVDSEELNEKKSGSDPSRRGRHPGSGRFWKQGHRGDDPGGPVCEGTQDPVSWNLPGNADGDRGIRPPCAGIRGRQQYRAGSCHEASCDRADAGSGKCGRHRRDTETWKLSLRTGRWIPGNCAFRKERDTGTPQASLRGEQCFSEGTFG